MQTWESYIDDVEVAEEQKAIIQLAQIVDENYYALTATGRDALEAFIYDLDQNHDVAFNSGDDNEWEFTDCLKVLMILVNHYIQNGYWDRTAMDVGSRQPVTTI